MWALKLVLSRLASRGRSRQLALHDICVAFFHASLEQPVWVQPLEELGLQHQLWLVEKALFGMREASKAFQTQVHRMFAEDGWVTVKTVPCLACHVRRDTLCGFYGDDFFTEGEPSALDEVDQSIVDCFQAKIMPPVGPGDMLVRGRCCVAFLCGARPVSFCNPTRSTSRTWQSFSRLAE